MSVIQRWFFFNDDKKEHLKALDGLRGIAVILVLLSHSSNNEIFFHPSLAFHGIGKGGVYLFYVLSAFLLDRQIAHALIHKTADAFFWKRYFLRRFLRIYPLFIVSLIVFWCMSVYGIPTSITNAKEIMMHIFLLEGESVFWSVPVEFKYYILSPFILLFCHQYLKWNLRRICIFFFLLSIFTLFIDFYFQLNKISTFKYLPVFLTGTFLAIYNLKFSIPLLIKKWGKIVGVAGFVALLVCIMMNPNYVAGNWLGIDTSNNGRKIMIIYAILCGIMLFVTLYSEGLFKRFLETRLLRFIGVISFSVYLFHLPMIYFINSSIMDIPEGLKIYFFFGTTILISTITYLMIERPMSRIRISRSPAVLNEIVNNEKPV